MIEEDQSRVEQYLERAAMLRTLAAKTQYPEARQRLLGLAASLERLADQVEHWENTRLPRAAG